MAGGELQFEVPQYSSGSGQQYYYIQTDSAQQAGGEVSAQPSVSILTRHDTNIYVAIHRERHLRVGRGCHHHVRGGRGGRGGGCVQ